MPFGRRPRRLTRFQIAWLRRSARKRERFIAEYEFPRYLRGRIRKRLPALSREEIELVERGLREWFVCCAWRWNAVLGMPSRAVDEAWHEFTPRHPRLHPLLPGSFRRLPPPHAGGGDEDADGRCPRRDGPSLGSL
jgi:hypothetical protein